MIPVRAVAETLGAEVKWDDATKTATVTYVEEGTRKPRHCYIEIGSSVMRWEDDKDYAIVNGGTKGVEQLDSPAVIVDSRTLLPIRAVAEVFGFAVAWDDATKTVSIQKN